MKDFLLNIVDAFSKTEKKVNFSEIATALNNAGFKTSSGGMYKGGRGTAKIIRDLHKTMLANKDYEKALDITKAVVDVKGEHAWKK